MNAAELIIKTLEHEGVEYIFGIPGAKVDSIFDALENSKIKMILCRHEQNACFMAAAYGRLTGHPGVVLVTSGPGVGNLCTGLLTATTEGDPVVAIGANVPRDMLYKSSHQSAKNEKILEGVTKLSKEIYSEHIVSESLAEAFRVAKAPKEGACFLSFPQDVLLSKTSGDVVRNSHIEFNSHASPTLLSQATHCIELAKNPVLFLGMRASKTSNTEAIRSFLHKHPLPVVSTYQAAGVISHELMSCFFGRVGLFENQPGDELLKQADLVVTIGYDCVEYDTEIWNAKNDKQIMHIDRLHSELHQTYQPNIELLGNIPENLNHLKESIQHVPSLEMYATLKQKFKKHVELPPLPQAEKGKVHPLAFIHKLHDYVDDEAIVCCDIGSHYMWMARYFLSHIPHQILFSNGQQTLGVGFPWGMAAKLKYPNKNVFSVSGDGGFLFSAMELETAVREKIKTIHFVWVNGSYNMVEEQQMMKYKRKSAVDLGYVNLVQFAESFGATGFVLDDIEHFDAVMEKALASKSPVIIEMPVDYSSNPELFKSLDPNTGN